MRGRWTLERMALYRYLRLMGTVSLPLSYVNTRRFRDLEGQAPQLYGAVASTTGAGSEGSGSYSKEQLENEVRRQVELAMSGHRELADENLRLKQELELLKTSRMLGAGDVNAAERGRNEMSDAFLENAKITTFSGLSKQVGCVEMQREFLQDLLGTEMRDSAAYRAFEDTDKGDQGIADGGDTPRSIGERAAALEEYYKTFLSSAAVKKVQLRAEESGCQRANCKFVHDWANIPKEEKHDRCKGCSARGHMKRNCPLKDNEAPRKGGEGKSAPQPKVKNAQPTGPRAADEREDGTASGGGPSTASSQNTSASSTLNEPTSTSTQQGSEKAMPGEMDDFLKNATQILKIMAEKQGSGAAPPSMKMLKKAVRRMENRMALMDSGATHPLREAQPEEWSQAPEVDVVIAGDGVTTMRQNLAGTLLTEPLKPGGNDEAMKVHQDPQWERSLKKYVEKGKFEDGYCAIFSMPWATDVMNEDLVKTVTDLPRTDKEAWGLMLELGFNRRMRKRMMHKDWIVKFFSGRRSPVDKMFKMFENNGTMVLDVDTLRISQLNMLRAGNGVMKLMLWGAATGRIAGIFAGVPRNNSFEHALRVIVVNEVAKMGRKVMCEAADVPEDGVAMSIWASSQAEEDESSTVWLHKWFRQWVSHNMMDVHHFEQGALGHPLRHYVVVVGAYDGEDVGPRNAEVEARDCYVMSADTLGPVRVPGPKGEKYAVVFTYQFSKMKMGPQDVPVEDDESDGWNLDAKVSAAASKKEPEHDVGEDLGEYSPDEEPGVPLDEAVEHWECEHGPLPELPEVPTISTTTSERIGRPNEDWWEFREVEGVLVRHQVIPRLQLFRPTVANGCPVPPIMIKLEPTRVTEVKFVGGGVDMETSDWHGYKSGARALEKKWTGTSTFKVSQAEVTEEEEVLDKDEKSWEALSGDLTKPVEMETIYMVYPIRNKRGGDIMLAIQEAVLRLKLLGFLVARLHSDRGSEFGSKGLRKWLLERDIYHTRSESLVPQTNGAAERGVRWFKTKAKVLLAEANVAVKYWTLAMQQAANRQIYYKLGISKPPLLPCGTSERIRRKVFGNNKKYDLTDRWEQVYLGLSDTIKGGAIVLRPTGILTETLNLRSGVVDPRRLLREPSDDDTVVQGEGRGDQEEEQAIIDLPEANHRLRGKQAAPELRAVRKGEETTLDGEQYVLPPEEWAVMSLLERQEHKAQQYYDQGKFDVQSCGEVLQELCISGKTRVRVRGQHTASMILGAYVHGGVRGVSAEAKRRMWLSKYLNQVLKEKTSVDLGEEGSWTTLGIFKATTIPPHKDQRNRPGSLNYAVEIGGSQSGGLWLAGKDYVRQCKGGSDARELQQELPDGVVLDGTLYNINQKAIAFDPKGEHAYLKPEVERWILVGFTPLGVEKLPPGDQSALRERGFPLAGTGVDKFLEEYLPEYDEDWECGADIGDSDEEELECRARTLRCVLQQEVEGPELEAQGYHKEVDALISSGTIRRLSPEQTRELKKQGLKVLPGKAVFTAKPPSEENFFMVFQLQQWWFWLELQLQETWKIERVLYGLREAPRLWSLFRNDGLQAARIPYDGKMLILLSLDTDENLWKICYEGQEQEPEGLMLIYVDDILVLSQPDIISRRYTGGLQLSGSVPHWRCWWVDHYGFWGVELKVQDNGIHMSQSGYVRDLLRQHGVQERAGDPLTVPCSREWLQDEESGDEDGAPEEATIRMAQKATGEALWLSTRSRPELAHSVACMAGKALKKPLRTLEISKRVIQYLAKTADYGIMYKPSRDDPLLVVYSDASFAPGGGRSFGCVMAQIGGMPVAWRASKQPVITLSVAEAELYEGVAAVQLGLGVGAMMSEVAVYPVMHLRIDNAAAQGLASQAPGSWKTRHLRVRARFLRQEVSAQRLVITHVPGSLQKADIGTKGFDLPKFKELMSLWGNLPYSLEVGSPALRSGGYQGKLTSGWFNGVVLRGYSMRGGCDSVMGGTEENDDFSSWLVDGVSTKEEKAGTTQGPGPDRGSGGDPSAHDTWKPLIRRSSELGWATIHTKQDAGEAANTYNYAYEGGAAKDRGNYLNEVFA
ncbi:Copia protein [Symbiodinium microadriaticum]|uniref:Copia protein n=1 Tax=Symbiodinium microadriaticum TaxID=2951 RepID=A0A1Q9EZE7_SYMMI|nr:Copia protein [Symbiodinium microadriaticum]